MAAIRTHEGRMQLAKEMGRKLADLQKQSQSELDRNDGAVGILGIAHQNLQQHKDFWKQDFDEEKIDRPTLDKVLEAIDNCCGILRNLETQCRVQMQREHGKTDALAIVAAHAQELCSREVALLEAVMEPQAEDRETEDGVVDVPLVRDVDGEPIIHTGVHGRQTSAERRAEDAALAAVAQKAAKGERGESAADLPQGEPDLIPSAQDAPQASADEQPEEAPASAPATDYDPTEGLEDDALPLTPASDASGKPILTDDDLDDEESRGNK